MMSASAAIRRTVPALTGDADPVDLPRADPGDQGVQSDPDDHGHRRHPVHRGAVAAGDMPEHLDRGVGAQLGESAGLGARVRVRVRRRAQPGTVTGRGTVVPPTGALGRLGRGTSCCRGTAPGAGQR